MKAIRVDHASDGMKFAYRALRRFSFTVPVEGVEPIDLGPGDFLTLSAGETWLGATAVAAAKTAVAEGALEPVSFPVSVPPGGRSGPEFFYAGIE